MKKRISIILTGLILIIAGFLFYSANINDNIQLMGEDLVENDFDDESQEELIIEEGTPDSEDNLEENNSNFDNETEDDSNDQESEDYDDSDEPYEPDDEGEEEER
jgi:ribonuclease E